MQYRNFQGQESTRVGSDLRKQRLSFCVKLYKLLL
jgi:hypothetical protein